jgi:hypothetical protein
LLQTGQARLGAFLSFYRILAFEPYAPVGRADWGRSRLGAKTTEEKTTEEKTTEEKPTVEKPTVEKPTEEKPTEEKPDWGRSRLAPDGLVPSEPTIRG